MRADERWRSIPGLANWAAEEFGETEAVVDGPVRLSFRELGRQAQRAARGFAALGVEPGDRVAIWAPNLWEWVVALLGLQAAGAVLVPLNTRFKGEEAAYVLEKSRARALVVVEGFLGNDYVDLLRGARGGEGEGRPVAGLPQLETLVVARGPAPPGTLDWEEFLARAEAVDPDEIEARTAAIRPEDLSDIMFTSGTTGRPKGVLATHAQTLRVYAQSAETGEFRRGERYLIPSPFFHSFGYKYGIVVSLVAGATMLPLAVFDPDGALELIQAERVNRLPGPPTVFLSLLNHPRLAEYDLSSLRAGAIGAAGISEGLIERIKRELGYELLLSAYGLTEATATVTSCVRGDDPETIATTSGRPIPDVEVRIVDDAGNALPAGDSGEIWVRGYNVMQGYFEDPQATAEALTPDGWLRTGDIGHLDERGYLSITDRKKDMFIVGGFNAYPAEIESLLLQNPAIDQAAVIGVPDERLGEVGKAFVTLRAGSTAGPEELRAWAREQMANYKVPRSFEILGELPLTPSGKVMKHVLRERQGARP